MRSIEVTKEMFPIGVPVLIEAIADVGCGWDFDAPLHIMRPFHLYREVGSVGVCAIERAIEDVMIDLDCGNRVNPDMNDWPYSEKYLDSLFLRARRGKARRSVYYLTAEVTVKSWAANDNEYVDYDFRPLRDIQRK